MDLTTLHRRTVETWVDRVRSVPADRWQQPTPCRAWRVRDLVNHLTAEDLWTTPLLGGATLEEVGDRFDGDLLGEDPGGTALAAAQEAAAAVATALPAGGTVQLSYGVERMDEYVHQLAADHLVHAWDLAAATGGDRRLDPDLVSEVASWFAGREELYRAAGIVGSRLVTAGDAQDLLLAAFGRDPHWGPNHAAAVLLSDAFASGDVEQMVAVLSEDCVFEATSPAPDGRRHVGAEEIRRVWTEMFAGTRDPAFTEEELHVAGDRGLLRWRYDWVDQAGDPGHVRGVDVLRLRDGLVTEKLSYVKG